MTAFIAFAMRNWKLVGIGLLVIAFGITLAIKNGQISSRDRTIEKQGGQIVALQRDLTQCRANKVALENGIRAQNEAVEAARAAGASRLAELERSAVAARAAAQAANARAAAILARRPGANQCADALDLIREQ